MTKKTAAKLTLQSATAIGKLVDTVIKVSVDLDPQLHEAAVQCLMHAEKHGDTTLADRLVKGLGKATRIEALKLWYHDFSPIRWNGDGKVGQLKEGQKDFKAYDAENANANPFFSYAPGAERTVRPITIVDMFKIVDNAPDRVLNAVKEDATRKLDGNASVALHMAQELQAAWRTIKAKYADGSKDPTAVEAPAGVEPLAETTSSRNRKRVKAA
jgi:hypothetical protein